MITSILTPMAIQKIGLYDYKLLVLLLDLFLMPESLFLSASYGEMVIFYNNRLTVGAYSNAIQNVYTLLLTEFSQTFYHI